MFLQTNIYRKLGLLLFHRGKYPFGSEDRAAMAYSESILAEVKTCRRLSGAYPFKVGFPLLVAGFEVRDPVRRD